MTRKEAISVIRQMLATTDLSVRANLTKKMIEACHMAIDSLKVDEAYQLEYERTTEEKYCDRNICASNDVNGIGCEDCEVTKSQERTTKNDLLHCQHTDEEIAKSFIEDVEAVKDLLPTTKSETLVSLGVYKQVAWERDIAIQQLHELGYEFGQKIEPTTKKDLGVDAVSRQEVLYLVGDYDLSMGQVVKGIHALPSVTPQEPRWIPVSERLPDTEDEVLCWYEYYHWSQEKILPEYGIGRYMDNEWCGEVSIGVKARVIAWQPLPEPYKMESEDV